MIPRPDFVVTAADGRPLLSVEAYSVIGTPPALTRRDYLAAVPAARYTMFFMLVCKDRTYVWKSEQPDDAPPDYCGDTRSAFAPFIDERRNSFDGLYGLVFEMVVSRWLFALTRPLPEGYLREQPWLCDSGLYGMMRGAEVEMPAAA